MAYTNVYSEGAPLGSVTANLIDDLMRSGKVDIRERLESIFGAGIFSTDPVTIAQLKFTAATSKIISGSSSIKFRDSGDANDNLIVNGNGDVNIRGNLLHGANYQLLSSANEGSLKLLANAGGAVAWTFTAQTSDRLALNTTGAGGASVVTVDPSGLVTIKNGLTITTSGLGVTGNSSFGSSTVTVFQNGTRVLDLERTDGSAALMSIIKLKRQGTTKGFIGLTASDTLCFLNAAESVATFIVDNNGNATVVANLTVAGANADLGSLRIVTTGSGNPIQFINIGSANNFVFRNNANSSDNLTIQDDGTIIVRNNITVNGAFISFGNAVSRLVAGATSIAFRNNANTKDNVITTNNGQTTITGDSATPPLILDRLDAAAALITHLLIRRNTSTKARIGLDASDNLVTLDATGANANITITDAGLITLRNTLSGTIADMSTGFRIGGAAASGAYLKGNGTNFVSGTIASGDLPSPITTNIDTSSLKVGGGTAVTKILTGTTSWNPGTINAGSAATTTVTVTGAATGDVVIVDNIYMFDTNQLVLMGRVSAADTVELSLRNFTGGNLTPTTRTYRVAVLHF